jgi:hypothetical protein
MKNIILTIVILFAGISCEAQFNYLNTTEVFDGIKFNNISLGNIMTSSGDLTKMKTFFGSDIQETPNNTGIYIGKELSNDNIVFSFEDETDTGNNYNLTTIIVLDSSVIVNVKGLSVKIGDHKRKFRGFKLNSNNKYNFTDKDTGSTSLFFKIDKNNKVSEIEYISY